MSFSLQDFASYSREKSKNVWYYSATPTENLVCPHSNCNSINLTPDLYFDPVIYTVVDNEPAIVTFHRTYYKCKSCGKYFFCDNLNLDRKFGNRRKIMPEYRDKAISYWLRHKIEDPFRYKKESMRQVGIDFGIDSDNLEDWVKILVSHFDEKVMIRPYSSLYFGAFNYQKDKQQHGFIVADEDKGYLLSFINDYSGEGLYKYINDNFEDKGKTIRVRYDYSPGVGKALQKFAFSEGTVFIINRLEFRRMIKDLLRNYEEGLSELAVILGIKKDPDKNIIYKNLKSWANRIPDTYKNKEQVLSIIEEVTATDHLYNSFVFPVSISLPDTVRRYIDSKAGQGSSYEAMKLQILYDNEQWAEAIRRAGSKIGYKIENITAGSTGRDTEKTTFKGYYNSNMKISGFEMTEEDITALMEQG